MLNFTPARVGDAPFVGWIVLIHFFVQEPHFVGIRKNASPHLLDTVGDAMHVRYNHRLGRTRSFVGPTPRSVAPVKEAAARMVTRTRASSRGNAANSPPHIPRVIRGSSQCTGKSERVQDSMKTIRWSVRTGILPVLTYGAEATREKVECAVCNRMKTWLIPPSLESE